MNAYIDLLIKWLFRTIGYVGFLGVPIFILVGLYFVSPSCMIWFYGVDPHTTLRDMVDIYPQEFMAISAFITIFIVGIYSAYIGVSDL